MTLNLSTQFITTLSLLGVVALSTACGSSSANTAAGPNGGAGAGGLSSVGGAAGISSPGGASTTGGTAGEAGSPECPDFRGSPVNVSACPGPADMCLVKFGGCGGGVCVSCITPVAGMSFAGGMFSVADDSGVTTANLRTEPGAVCMAGTDVGIALFWLELGPSSSEPLDATALGITQVEFTVDTPPSSGVAPIAAILLPDGTIDIGSSLTSNGHAVSVVSTSTVRASLSDFQNPNVTFDPSRLLSLGFSISPSEHYDFCIRDLKFLDANDVEVMPP